MKERPILINAEMVKAVLEGRKSQTRRVITNIKPDDPFIGGFPDVPTKYQVGQRLWVRETWRPYSEKEVRIQYKADGLIIDYPKQSEFSFYACGQSWHPSIHMPRWASRILLEITGVRVEQIQDCSLNDIKAEGIDTNLPKSGSKEDEYFNQPDNADLCPGDVRFRDLWDSINYKRGYGWESNCWVWVLSFRRIE